MQDPVQPMNLSANPPSQDSLPAVMEGLDRFLKTHGVEAALAQLLKHLEEKKKYQELFDALLLAKRHELGLPLVQLGPATELDSQYVAPFEAAISAACEKVGGLFLQEGDLVRAWPYLRAIGENARMRQALDQVEAATRRKDIENLIEIALHEGVHPSKGLEMVVHHFGICSSITHFDQLQHSMRSADRNACVRLLVNSLYRDLLANIQAEAERRFGKLESGKGLLATIETHPELFEGDAYYIDTSHLHSIIRFGSQLSEGEELDKAIELCEYGRRISKIYHFDSGPPFDDFYVEQAVLLRGLREAGRKNSPSRQAAGELFAAKARKALEEKNADYPFQQIIYILAQLEFFQDAIHIAREFENLGGSNRPLSPSVYELCQMAGEFGSLCEYARGKMDLVHFTAGLIQAARSQTEGLPAARPAGASGMPPAPHRHRPVEAEP